jgi:beta-amylase
MQSFKQEFSGWLGGNITELLIGLGPNASLKYPAHPLGDGRWEYPGSGEVQVRLSWHATTCKQG